MTEFAVLGYRGASTSRIADLAEVPQPHVYANFTAKRDLFLACVSRAAETVMDAATERGHAQLDALKIEQRLLLQAFASIDDPELRDDLRELLASVQERIGGQRMERLIAQASRLALESPGE